LGTGGLDYNRTFCAEIFRVTAWRILKNLKKLPLKAKEAKYVPKEKLGPSVLSTLILVRMPTWPLLNTAKTLTMRKKVRGKRNNGQVEGLGR
jgi:hypothetical protein